MYLTYLIIFAAGIAIGWLAHFGYGRGTDSRRSKAQVRADNNADSRGPQSQINADRDADSRRSGKGADGGNEDKKDDTSRGDEKPVLKTKKARMNKLMEEIKKRERITNDEVQELLGVSDATATRYLNELEEKDEMVQKGEGRGVYYRCSEE